MKGSELSDSSSHGSDEQRNRDGSLATEYTLYNHLPTPTTLRRTTATIMPINNTVHEYNTNTDAITSSSTLLPITKVKTHHTAQSHISHTRNTFALCGTVPFSKVYRDTKPERSILGHRFS